jgi:hypothetical protein
MAGDPADAQSGIVVPLLDTERPGLNGDTTTAVVRAMIEEAQRLEEAAYTTSKGHFEAHSVLGTIHFALGCLAALSGAIAGGGALVSGSTGRILTGIFGATAAIASALLTFAKPQETADKHQTVGTRYNALVGRIRRFRGIDIHDGETAPSLQREALERFAREKAELDNAGPGVPNYAYQRAVRRIEERERLRRNKSGASHQA